MSAARRYRVPWREYIYVYLLEERAPVSRLSLETLVFFTAKLMIPRGMTELPEGNAKSELFAEEEFRKQFVKLCDLLVGLDMHVDLLVIRSLLTFWTRPIGLRHIR